MLPFTMSSSCVIETLMDPQPEIPLLDGWRWCSEAVVLTWTHFLPIVAGQHPPPKLQLLVYRWSGFWWHDNGPPRLRFTTTERILWYRIACLALSLPLDYFSRMIHEFGTVFAGIIPCIMLCLFMLLLVVLLTLNTLYRPLLLNM